MSLYNSYSMSVPDTPLEDIEKIHATVVSTFKSRKTIPISYRLDQLRNLYFAIKENEQGIVAALYQDLHRPENETVVCEVLTTLHDLVLTMEHLPKWGKDVSPSTDTLFGPMSPVIRSQPLGTVLIVAPWNYPVFLSLPPLIGAIAAGDTALVKMSESAPASAAIVSHIVHSALDSSAYRVITGALPQATALTSLKYDLIFFTGNGRIGKQIALAAAQTLTPTVLELGGKSPAIICPSADFKAAANRIVYGKYINAGQTCVAPDYVLLPRAIAEQFMSALKKEVSPHYTSIDKDSTEYSHIITDAAYSRVVKMIEKTEGEIIIGGTSTADSASKFIPPTIVYDVLHDDATMEDEIFGPILPIVLVDSVEDAISNINDNHDTPLALYLFSNDKAEQKHILDNTRSGGAMINGAVIHVGCPYVPFGGVGQSGYGVYHGKFSFDTFSHQRAILTQPKWTDLVTKMIQPPYSNVSVNRYKLLASPMIWFARSGPIPTSVLGKAIGRIMALLRFFSGRT
ncbi:Hfd1p [Lipomyces arxii]|uniref:Hfd1p n=1 Tax=Lipomyces arxii TaxID=56418 RepID=UPI0034CF0B14